MSEGNTPTTRVDFLIIGAGPAGQKAAVQAAKGGRSVWVVERGSTPGGECVHRGTIPSKTLRESALYLSGLERRAAGWLRRDSEQHAGKTDSLMRRLDQVLQGHERYLGEQLERNDIVLRQGRAQLLSGTVARITGPRGDEEIVRADKIVIATGSRPRQPENIEIDHEHVLDSDSVLSLLYLPKSLTVIGAGVIASEFATIFRAVGVEVTMMDRRGEPLGFLDAELRRRFVSRFEADGGRFLGNAKPTRVAFDGVDSVEVELEDGEIVRSEKVLVALGRTASVNGLGLENAGIELSDRGFVPVDENCRTVCGNVYAAGDVIGPPALATASMEQGRRAARHALGMSAPASMELLPTGIYTIPEMASIGLTEEQAREAGHDVLVGRAEFDEIARGLINGAEDGLLKLVVDKESRRLLGAHVFGEGATELVHLAQLAMIGGLQVDAFVDHLFNFPTMAEAYRVAALDVGAAEARIRGVA